MIRSNKTVTYRLRAVDTTGLLQLIDDSADVQLPSIDKMTDTVKGAGILGEIDMPSLGQIASMTMTVNFKADNPAYAKLARPGFINLELVWVVDVINTTTRATTVQQHKAFATVLNKKYNPGKIEAGATTDGSSEFEVSAYRKVVDGLEVMNIDKLNSIFSVDGTDYMAQVNALTM